MIFRLFLIGVAFLFPVSCSFVSSKAEGKDNADSLSCPFYFISDTSSFLEELLRRDPFFEKFLARATQYEIQIIYTRIDRDSVGCPHFRSYAYRVNEKEYFNPASFVKLPVTMIALEKLQELQPQGIDLYTRIRYHASHECQTPFDMDLTAPEGFPSLGHLIKRALLVSDDEAYNRLYEFTGQQTLNEKLWQKGYHGTCIIQRFRTCSPDGNRYTNPVDFIDSKGKIIWHQPMLVNPYSYHNPLGNVRKGKEHMAADGTIKKEPKDYSYANCLPLRDLHDMFLSLLFPSSVPSERCFLTGESYRRFVLTQLALYPFESDIALYHDRQKYPYNYKKYFLWENNPSLLCLNVNAFSHGYMGDCAYIADAGCGVEFILLAVINTNETESIRPENYQYATVGIPFLRKLAKKIYEVEKARTKTFLPDFREWDDLLKKRKNETTGK